MLGAIVFCALVGQNFGMPDAPKIDVSIEGSHVAVVPGDKFAVLVHMKISEPWHVYWKNPGDSGLPTKIDWQLPKGWTASELEFPAPERLKAGELISYGFEKDLTMLSWISVPADETIDKAFDIRGKLSWLACIESCLPGSAPIVLGVRTANAPWASPCGVDALSKFRSEAPKVAEKDFVAAWATGTGYVLRISDAKAKDIFFFADSYDVVSPGAEQNAIAHEGYVGVVLVKSPYSEKTATRLKGVLTYTDGEGQAKAYAVDVPIEANLGRQGSR